MKKFYGSDTYVQSVGVKSDLEIDGFAIAVCAEIAQAAGLTLACPRCGLGRDEFRKSGRLGCPECYKTFMAELTMAVKAMHHSVQHVGKIPAREGAHARIKSQIARLQKDLVRSQAVEPEEEPRDDS